MQKRDTLPNLSLLTRMLSVQQLQELKQAHPRIYRQATLEQKKQIAATYEKTGSISKAFKEVRAFKIMPSDLEFHGQRYGGGR